MISNILEKRKARLLDLEACLLHLINTSDDEGEREWLEQKVDEIKNKIKEIDK